MASYTEDTREQALTQLMHLYGDSIKRMCGVYLRDMGMADDAAQETLSRHTTTSTNGSTVKSTTKRRG